MGSRTTFHWPIRLQFYPTFFGLGPINSSPKLFFKFLRKCWSWVAQKPGRLWAVRATISAATCGLTSWASNDGWPVPPISRAPTSPRRHHCPWKLTVTITCFQEGSIQISFRRDNEEKVCSYVLGTRLLHIIFAIGLSCNAWIVDPV